MANDKENKDRENKDPQNYEPDDAELQHKVSDKQAPNDTDKLGLSPEQRANTTVSGAVERESVGEFGSDEETKDKEKRVEDTKKEIEQRKKKD